MSLSSNQRGKLRAKLWKAFREVGGSDIEIERDPMHARYEVNRHGLQITGPKAVLDDVFDRTLALLVIHGWKVSSGKVAASVSYGETGHEICIERPIAKAVWTNLPKGEYREQEAYVLVHI